MPPGQRAYPGSDWPQAFTSSLDYGIARGTVLKGFMTTDRQGQTKNSNELRFKLTNKVGLVRGPWAGYQFATPWYACSLWTIVDPDPLFPNKGYYLRCSTYPNSGPRRTEHFFRSFNGIRDNSYSVIDYSDFLGLKDKQKQFQSFVPEKTQGGGSSTGGVWGDARDYYYSNLLGGFGQPSTTGVGGGTGGGGGGSGSGGGANTDTTTAYALDSAVRLVVRMPIGYAGVGKSQSRNPGFVQTWTEPDGNIYTEEFYFRYIPQNIKYDGLASEWVEIPRAENIPFVDWAKWQLMKVSMSFLIASDRIEPGGQSVPDGMQTAVEPEIQKLRQMAQRKQPIAFINMDELLTVQLRRGKDLGRGLEFVINDLSVTATRRVTDFTDGNASVPSGIAVAQVEMTFTEVPVERVSLVYLPPIGAPPLPVPKAPKPPGPGTEYGKETDNAAPQNSGRSTNVYTDDAATGTP